jgi:Ca2+-binding RTX toxin-like protein
VIRAGRPVLVALLVLFLLPSAPLGAQPECRGRPATIVGTGSHDHLEGTSDDDVIVGLGGRDVIEGRRGDDLICTGPGGFLDRDEDFIEWQRVTAGPGADIVIGGGSYDFLVGDDGDDRLRARGGLDQLYGKAGGDLLRDGAGRSSLYGGIGGDRLLGGRGPDVLAAAEAGRDRLQGGHGRDQGSAALAGAYIRIDLEAGVARGTVSDRDTVAGIEDLLGFPGTRNVFIGDDADNRLIVEGFEQGARRDSILIGKKGRDVIGGWFGDDLLRGGSGGDLLRDPGGSDRHVGGPGVDRLDFTYENIRRVMADLRAGVATQGSQIDELVTLEGLIGTSSDDVLKGDARRNRIAGRGGDDDLRGRAGPDLLRGGTGSDVVDGGAGNDNCRGEVTLAC